MERYRHLEGYEFSGCAVRRWNILSFFGTKWQDKDALETRPTGIFFYYPDDPPAKRWAYRGIGDTTGIHGAPAFLPDERWIFVMDDGEVFVVGGGYDDWEERITPKKPAYFSRVRTIANGRVYAVGVNRRVFRRDAKDQWVSLERGLPKKSDKGDPGFDDISGFSDSEIYACGGDGDLWMFNGRTWSQVDLPTNVALWRITCGGDGLAYILTEERTVIVGRGDSWRILEQDATKSILEELVWFQDRIYVSTVDGLFEIAEGKFVPTRLKLPEQNSYAHLAAGDGILLVAGANEACMFDGKKWTTILEPLPE